MVLPTSSPFALPAGMRDLLPPRAGRRRALARAVLNAFARRGYELAVLPAFEREEVLALGLGARDLGDVVRFLDPDSGEVLVLRPDMTPQIARVAATRYRDAPMPLRLSYEGSLVRRPRGRARRHRQVAQAGLECIGWGHTDADVEVIAAVSDALTDAGVEGFKLELGHAGLAAVALASVPEAARERATEALNQRDERAWTEALADHPEAARALSLLASLAGGAGVLERAWEALTDPRYGPALGELTAVREGLARAGLGDRVLVDLGEVRGFGYYTGVRFEVLCEGASEPVAAGGRYDDLLARYGAPRPATGCAIDLELLEDALATKGLGPEEGGERVAVGGQGEARRACAERLRAGGARVAEVPSDDVGAVLGFARAGNYARVLVCGAFGELELDPATGAARESEVESDAGDRGGGRPVG